MDPGIDTYNVLRVRQHVAETVAATHIHTRACPETSSVEEIFLLEGQTVQEEHMRDVVREFDVLWSVVKGVDGGLYLVVNVPVSAPRAARTCHQRFRIFYLTLLSLSLSFLLAKHLP